MSKWRVELDIAFDTEDDAIEFINGVEAVKNKVYQPTGAEKIEVKAACRYHECFHDENPPKPCGEYKTVDFKKSAEVHLTKAQAVAEKARKDAEAIAAAAGTPHASELEGG
jgi:hypothetical protein